MAINEQNTILNVVPGGVIPVVNVSQYDVGRVLTFTLYDGNNVASIPSGTTVKVEGTKPSRHAFSYGSPVATITGNGVTVSTADQMTAEAGSVECKLVLTYNSQVIGTAMFILECEVAGVQDDVDISDTVLPVYMEAGRQNMLNAEAWAKGTKDGTAVGSGEPQYHNNAKYWNDQTGSLAAAAANSATAAAGSAATSQTNRDQAKSWAVPSTDPDSYGTNTNNSKYWCNQSQSYYTQMQELAIELANKVNSIQALLNLFFGSVYLTTESGDRLLTETGDNLIIDY